MPSEWMVARFGGDEFFIGGKLDVGIGYATIEPYDEISVEKSLQKADALMYVIKKSHHREMQEKLV